MFGFENDVEKSNLTVKQKQEAIQENKKVMTTTVLVVVITALLLWTPFIFCYSKDIKIAYTLYFVSMGVFVIFVVIYALCIKSIFPKWNMYRELIDKGFDGLTEDEINKLKPDDKEKQLIKEYHKKDVIAGLIFLASLIVEFTIIIKLGIAILSPITSIITLIITAIWYIKMDTYKVEIHRIESGYYKRSFGFICKKCRNKVKINFSEIEKYKDLPKNQSGIKVMKCLNCNNDVEFLNFDLELKDYKDYLDKIRKLEI